MTRDRSTPPSSSPRPARAMDFAFSDQQFGPRSPRRSSPAVVIAGAGSGKTTVMAARVVWLVATGQVAPDESSA